MLCPIAASFLFFVRTIMLYSSICHSLRNPRPEEAQKVVIYPISSLHLEVNDPQDPGHVIYANIATLKACRILNKQYVVLRNCFKPELERIGQIRVIESRTYKFNPISKNPHLFVPPSLMFNLQLPVFPQPSIFLRPMTIQDLRLDKEIIPSFRIQQKSIQETQIPYATKATIARVRQAAEEHVRIDSEISRASLKQFFALPHVLSAGDVFGVAASSQQGPKRLKPVIELPPSMIMSGECARAQVLPQVLEPESLETSNMITFYKVIDIEGNNKSLAYLVDYDNTTVVEDPSISNAIPNAKAYEDLLKGTSNRQRVEVKPPIVLECAECKGECRYADIEPVDDMSLVHVDPTGFHQLLEAFLPLQDRLSDKSKGRIKNSLAILLEEQNGTSSTAMIEKVGRCVGFHVLQKNYVEFSSAHSEKQIAENIHEAFTSAQEYAPCILHLSGSFGFALQKDDEAELAFCTALSNEIEYSRYSSKPVVLVHSMERNQRVPKNFSSCFTRQIVTGAPDEKARLHILQKLFAHSTRLASDVSLGDVAHKTAGRTLNEMVALAADAGAATLQQLSKAEEEVEQLACPDGYWKDLTNSLWLKNEQFDYAIAHQRTSSSLSANNPSVPNVKWEDIGGLDNVKHEIIDLIQLPTKCPELFASGVRQRSGILLYGPPGTGKTLLAKAIATECNMNFISVKGPELLNMYIGESEKNVRNIFELARNAKPCILFFDELDSLAPARGRGSDSGGVMDRVVSQLLTELDGVQQGADVFVVGATNRPDLLESALLRPGRFDRLLYLGIASSKATQLKILQALTRKFTLAPDVHLEKIVELCPPNFTGADFYALCSSALAEALQGKIQEINSDIDRINQSDCYASGPLTTRSYLNQMPKDDLQVQVQAQDFTRALKSIIPSVSAQELAHYERLRLQFSAQSIGSSPAQS